MSNDRGEMLQDIADLASELCDARKHREPYHVWSASRNKKVFHHETRRPGLLTELHAMFRPGAAVDSGSTAFGSRPPLNVEAASLHLLIELAAGRWVWNLRLEVRGTVQGNIRALVGAASTMDSDQQAALLAELRSWHRRAEILTGWKTPPARILGACCPRCDSRNTLLVNLAEKSAFCNAWLPATAEDPDEVQAAGGRWCASVWDESTIGVLADHVRTAA